MIQDLRTKKYEFESIDNLLADRFLMVIKSFHPLIQDIYISSKNLDFSQIEFRATRDVRIQMEYVFRKVVGLSSKYLMDSEYDESPLEITGEDGYVIF